ncbi:unnamed protein product [Brassica napus]|uniref:(rape) hypothetical protein n=1 Tax=Brassica napus TaxID=3708 RepID=A0A816QGW3_BRANA|nr:unnamed protein product [Brassica napus]
MFKDIVDAMREGRRLVSPQNGKGHQLKTLPLHLNRRFEPGLMGRTREGRACRRIKVQMCPQMLVPRKIKLQNRALFYWTKINPLFRIYRRRMLDIWKRGMLLWHFAVQRVIEQGNLLLHSNLLIQQTTRPKTLLDKKPRTSRTWWYQILRTSLEWLEDCVSLLL